ncbi:hypothetical protein HWB51_gp124 [Mycobacterium phage Cuke]|uniref:Uncharacterized protein n=1 Tax=Mycobacterium phage Cuke TaxID=2079417 RepID=A0A2L1IWZ0_9CAUD|nr:hypothetical protein HWB51_gp124 [Mycobacterium phage Cuke]AVD99688.1 hypothetical protein SEA_CUKE_72 [Mycobacterium phage Cuke]
MMKIKVRTFIACEQCDKEFGGPDAGDYSDWNPIANGMSLPEFLAGEALSFGWFRVVWMTEDVLLCCQQCVTKWMKEVMSHGN